jgi:HPt (histidine-containing phosphotransfer) domain-containing protein
MQTEMIQETDGPIDFGSLQARCLGNVQLVERVLKKFTVELEASLVALEKAVEGRDSHTFGAVAHRLKGMSANVAAWPLHECARQAEELAHGEDPQALAEQLKRIQEMRVELSRVLKREQVR